MVLVERDCKILNTVGKWRYLLGRHISVLCDFNNLRTSDRRLKKLIENGYLERKKIIYGIASFYFLTHKGRILMGMNKRADKVHLDKIYHDIKVLDTVIYFLNKYKIKESDITTEKELHIKDGFGSRRHHPDFMFNLNGEKYAVEVEITLKSKNKLSKNVQLNFINYDRQIWVVPQKETAILKALDETSNKFSNIEILFLEEVNND